MAKRITAKVEEYQKDGETKGKYVEIGVILNNDNGEYVLIDPTVNLAGVLAKQNILALNQGKLQRDNVMCSVFDNDNNAAPQQQGGYNQPAPQQTGGFSGQGQQQGGYQNRR